MRQISDVQIYLMSTAGSLDVSLTRDIKSATLFFMDSLLNWMKKGRHKKHFGSGLHISPYRQKWERIYSHGNAIIKILQQLFIKNKVAD